MSSIGRFRFVAAVAGLGVLNLLCASVALADATSSKTYWVKPNGSDDADCLSKETAGSVWKGWSIVTNNFNPRLAIIAQIIHSLHDLIVRHLKSPY